MAFILLPVSHHAHFLCPVGAMPGQYNYEKTKKDRKIKCIQCNKTSFSLLGGKWENCL